jgi:hypothetical protein
MVGRSRLARALSNLSRMTFVHFGSVFQHAFSDLAVFVESDPDHLLASVHDIVLRFYIEVMIFQFWDDVRSQKVSQIFPDSPMDSPMACVALLQRYIARCKTQLERLVEVDRSPHFFFYGESGNSRFIAVDAVTFQSLLDKRPFQDMVVNSVVPVRPSVRSVPGVSSSIRLSGRGGGFGPASLCPWHLAGLLGAKKSGGGVYSCVADCAVSRHPPLNAIKVADAYRLIDSASCNRHLKSVLRPLVAANRGRFSR